MNLTYNIEKRYSLREYQGDLVARSLYGMRDHKSVMLQSATGSGKTVIFIDVIRRCVLNGKRVLLLAHRKELIMQAQDKLFKMSGIIGGVIMSGYRSDYNMPVQIASVQTLTRRSMPKNIDVVIVDEAHHATASTYRKIIDNYPDAYLLGVTATPIRTNGQGFDHLFNHLICGPTIKELEQRGFLCTAKIPDIFNNRRLAKGLQDLKRNGGLVGGDYNQKKLSRILLDSKVSSSLVQSKLHFAKGKRTIVFCLDIANSKEVMSAYQEQGVMAAHVDGSTDKATRERLFKQFADATHPLEVLCNVGIATEGTDIPSIECVQLGRPTTSLSLYLQMVGRGSRLYEGKENYILLDHAGCIMEHGLPNDDRVWKLEGEGKVKVREYKKFRVTFNNGNTQILDSRTLPTGSEQLGVKQIETITEHFRRDTIDVMVARAKRRGGKVYSAYFKFIEAVQYDVSRMELNYLAKKIPSIKNKSGWVHIQVQQLALKRKQLKGSAY